MGTIKARYRCHECRELHEDRRDAQNCCPPEEVYVCSVCDQDYFRLDEAESCCPEEEGSDPDALPFISHAELEALGQLRLIP